LPTRYLSGVLRGLDNIFNFRSSQRGAPEEIELDLPVQTVLDVERIASYGSGFGVNAGWWIAATTHTHTVVGTLSTTLNPYRPAFSVNGYPVAVDMEDFMVWFYSGWAQNSQTADFDEATIGLLMQAATVGPSAAATFGMSASLMLAWDSFRNSTPGINYMFNNQEPPTSSPHRPVPMPAISGDVQAATRPAVFYTSVSLAAGTVTVLMNSLHWIGAKLAPPPAM